MFRILRAVPRRHLDSPRDASRHENGEQLVRLAEQRDAAARRLNRLQQSTATPLELVEELRVRDEELRATVDELAEQLDSVRHAASLLERERAKYVDLFEHAPDAYVVTNLAGVIEEANTAASALFRAEAAFLRGRSLVPRSSLVAIRTPFARCSAGCKRSNR